VLLADVARREAGARVFPIYVSVGLAWEQEELAMLGRLLRTLPFRDVQPVERLDFDMRDVYPPTHWAIRGEPPGFDTPDEDVYLEGRNIVLLTKAAIRSRMPRPTSSLPSRARSRSAWPRQSRSSRRLPRCTKPK
jgi:7-cyano-7-deazaguanine synthase